MPSAVLHAITAALACYEDLCNACMFGGFIDKYDYCVFATKDGYGETARMHLIF